MFHFQQLLQKKPDYWVALARLVEVMRRTGTTLISENSGFCFFPDWLHKGFLFGNRNFPESQIFMISLKIFRTFYSFENNLCTILYWNILSSINFMHYQSCYLGHLEDVPEYLKKSDEYVGTRASLIPGLNFCKVGFKSYQPLGLASFFDF